jgi:S1-C subfamily serine protease
VSRSAAALLCLFGAAAGAAAVLVIAKGAGWLGRDTSTVVIQRLPGGGTAAPVVVAKPLTGNGFAPAQIYRRRSPGVVTVISYFDAPTSPDASAGQGSGFVVASDGTIMTNAHVVTTAGQGSQGAAARARRVYVQFADGDRVTARILGVDLYDDVAVLRVDSKQHPLDPVPLGDSDRVVVGQPVAAIGSPFGNTNSLSVGVVSAIRRSIPSLTTQFNLVDAIQTDAPINHGNSGGPLFDARGEAIGINAQIRSSGSGSGFEGVGFAVPINSAKRSLDQLERTGRVSYAYVGISTEDLVPAVARRFGYAVRHGALIDSITPGSPAAKSGLVAGTRDALIDGLDVRVGGDAIVAINGIPVENGEDVVRIVAERLVPGEAARFTVVRGRQRRVVSVIMAARG